MPVLLPTEELRPGMRLAKAIFFKGRMMLPGGKQLSADDIGLLRKKYPFLTAQVGDPILDNLVDFEDDDQERQVATTAQGKIAGCMSEVYERFSKRASLAGMDFQSLEDTTTQVIGYLKSNPVSAALLSRSLDPDTYLTEHAGNVFYLSMILGSAVRDYVATERQRQTSANLAQGAALNLFPLALGSMFLDLGMVNLQHLFDSKNPLTEEDRQMVREHPISGADMLPSSFSPTARMTVRTHHENFDGSGYPNGVAGNKLHIFTRIVRITDSYDAATAGHVYADAKSPARVLWEMTAGPYARFYDPVLMKIFASLIQPFPIGSKLRLSDGRYAVLTKYNRRRPFSPTVVVAFDENNQPLPKDQLDGPVCLDDRPDLRLQSYGEEDISYIYDMNAPRDDVRMRSDFSTLFEAAFP